MKTPLGKPALQLALTLGLAVSTTGSSLAAVFTLDPTRSSVTLSGNVMGNTFQEQKAGSLTAQFEGTLNADVTDTSIVFTGSSVLAARNSGEYEPLAGGAAGRAPANYGAKASTLLASAVAAVRNTQFDVTSPAIAVSGGAFNSGSLTFQFLTSGQGSLDYKVSGFISMQGGLPLEGIATNRVTTGATISTSGGTQTLTIPVDTDFLFTLLSANDTTLTLSGQLVAVRSVGTAGTTFDNWVAANFPGVTDPNTVGPNADPEQDGVVNFVEFAFGLNPNATDPAPRPLQGSLNPVDPSQRILEFTRPKGLSGVAYVLQASGDLLGWTPLTVTPQVTDLGNGSEKLTYSDSTPMGASASRFLRLTVSPE